jgi:mRNA deadenylase 3'-5' endonuclease subunit Ccr4
VFCPANQWASRTHKLTNQPEKVSVGRIKVLHYNILADTYTGKDHAAHSYLGEHTQFSKRSAKILTEIRNSDSDIINLTEVDHYQDFYKPELNKLGYETFIETRRDKDSVLIGFKKSKFEFVK